MFFNEKSSIYVIYTNLFRYGNFGDEYLYVGMIPPRSS